MTIIQHSGYPVAVSQQLTAIIDRELDKQAIDTSLGFSILFRDPRYNAESGGYHPVEIYIDAQSRIKIITDYAYRGYGPQAELVKELDFDFFYEQFQQLGKKYPLQHAGSVFELWQANFCTDYASHVYHTCIDSFA